MTNYDSSFSDLLSVIHDSLQDMIATKEPCKSKVLLTSIDRELQSLPIFILTEPPKDPPYTTFSIPNHDLLTEYNLERIKKLLEREIYGPLP